MKDLASGKVRHGLQAYRLAALAAEAAGGGDVVVITEGEHEMDPVKRAAQFIRMNDLVVNNVAVIPIVTGTGTFAIAKTLQGFDFSPYSGPLWRLVYWYREA